MKRSGWFILLLGLGTFLGGVVYAALRPERTGDERKLVGTILRQRNYDHVPFARILSLLEKYNAIGRVRERAQAFTEKARLLISGFPDSPYQRALLAVTELVTERDH